MNGSYRRWSIYIALFFCMVGVARADTPRPALSPDPLPSFARAPFSVSVNFGSVPVADFATTSASTTNAAVSNIQMVGTSEKNYTFTVTPLADGPVAVSLPAGVVHADDGTNDPNAASNEISTTYDATAPLISGMPLSTTTEATSSLGAYLFYSDPTAADAGSGLSSLSCAQASTTIFAIGTTTVVCTATDTVGNTASSTFTVRVRDTTAPAITAPATQTFSAAGTTTVPSLTLATSTDAVDSAPAITHSPQTFFPGATTVTWTATDSSGNAATTTSLVVITEATTSPLSLSVSTTTGSALATSTDSVSFATTTDSATIAFDIPAGTVITGTSTWDGTFSLPAAAVSYTAPVPSSGNTASVVSAVSVGASGQSLTLDHAARLVFVGLAGKLVGWSQGSSFSPITAACSADSQAAGDALSAGADCKIDSAGDLVIWTKHFTTFIAYTEAATPAPTTSGGGGGGGGGGGSGSSSTNSAAIAASPSIGIAGETPTTLLQAEPQPWMTGEVLGAATYHFTVYLKRGSRGEDVANLQKILIAAGFLRSQYGTGYFGSLTEAAVEKYQSAHGIEQTGTVGPKTRAVLNKGADASGEVLGAATFLFAHTLVIGSRGTEVNELQKLLMAQKLLNIPAATGYYGSLTAGAVMAYQALHQLKPTGMVDALTREMLNK